MTPAGAALSLLGGRAGYTALGYRAATVHREQKGPPSLAPEGTSADYHVRADRATLAAVGDLLFRDAGIYRGIVNRFLDSTLGPVGYALDPQTGNARLNAAIKAKWDRFGQKPEVRGMFTWAECQRTALTGVINHGDGGAVLRADKQRFRFTEADEIAGGRAPGLDKKGERTGRLEQGIVLDLDGAPQAFYIAPRDDSGMVQARKAKRVKAGDFIYWPNLERFSQTRGVPVLQSVFAMVHRLEDICNSEAISWQTLAKFAVAVKRAGGAALAYGESAEDDEDEEQDGDAARRITELDEALVFHCEPGEEVVAIPRDLPGKDFPESVRMFLRLAGLPFGLPLEVILLDYSKTNYTASRAALEQAYRMFITWQSWLKAHLHTPLFEAWLAWEVAAGSFPDRETTFMHGWVAPEFPWIDQLKEAQAWGQRMDRGLATQTQALRSVNMDRSDWLEQRKAEVLEAIETAASINQTHPEAKVPWEIFAGIITSTQRGAGTADDAPNQDGSPQGAPEGDGSGPDPASSPVDGTPPGGDA